MTMPTAKQTAKVLLWEARWNVNDLLLLIEDVVSDEEGLSRAAQKTIANARAFRAKLENRKGMMP